MDVTGTPRGVGIGYRREHYGELPTCTRTLDWLEIVPENYVRVGGACRARLSEARERFPILAHGVSANIGGPDPLDADYLGGLKQLLDDFEIPFYTDHLCYARIGGLSFYDLLPLPRTEEAVKHTAARIRELADRLERPVAVENISYYAVMPGSALPEAEFIRAVCEEADCGLLFDVNNVYVNAVNHEQDPFEAMWALPLDRAWQIHLAGHVRQGPRLLDDHGSPVVDTVWKMYQAALEKLGPIPTLIEWDTKIPKLDTVLDEADKARAIFTEVTDG